VIRKGIFLQVMRKV